MTTHAVSLPAARGTLDNVNLRHLPVRRMRRNNGGMHVTGSLIIVDLATWAYALMSGGLTLG